MPRHAELDETSFQRRHTYVTVVSDLERGCVLHVADDRDQAALDECWTRLTAEQRAGVEAVAMDMWEPYVRSTQAHLPGAEVRRQEHRARMKDRAQRIWRREGLKVPAKQTPGGRLWLHDGRTLRLLTLMDEYTPECLAIRVARRLGSHEVLETVADVMLWPGIPEPMRSDHGPELIANALRTWLATPGTRALYITPGSPWENGYCESFNGTLRDDCVNGDIFYSLREAQIVIERWRV